MSPEEAQLVQAGRRADLVLPSYAEIAEKARASVAARPSRTHQKVVIADAPGSLETYIASLKSHPRVAAYFAEGFRVAMAELDEVYAIQPTIYIDHAAERASQVDANDVLSLAALTLPVPGAASFPAQFDPVRNMWVLLSPNPNLRISGRFAAPAQAGIVTFGFAVEIAASFVQVARYQGRYFLRDGYHRAFGLMLRGIARVPVFIKEFQRFEEMMLPAGLLPQDAYLGPRPPVLADYLNDEVSATVSLPAIQKMIAIPGLESALSG
jgi:hypothetical protein